METVYDARTCGSPNRQASDKSTSRGSARGLGWDAPRHALDPEQYWYHPTYREHSGPCELWNWADPAKVFSSIDLFVTVGSVPLG